MGLQRKKPLKQKTALKRTTKLRKVKSGVTAAQILQRSVLVARSASLCEFEKKLTMITSCWVRCGKYPRPGMVCHIYNRPKCGKARDLFEVAVFGCAECHIRFGDSLRVEKDNDTRPPLRYAQIAWDCIINTSKLGTDEDGNLIAAKDLGPRPEAGEGIYA